jgi:hypothetical protein
MAMPNMATPGTSNSAPSVQTLSTADSNPKTPTVSHSDAATPSTVSSAAGVSTQQLLGGLEGLKVGEMSMGQVNPNSFIRLNDSWNKVQVDAFLQSMQANPRATNVATGLNEVMRQRGVLPSGERVVGFFGGKFFTTNS